MAEKAENIIELKHITKVYSDNGFKAVDDFNLEVKRGEFVTFLGPSGCGKTTTLRMIAGFELPSSGEILLDGRDIAHLPANKRPINTVFQRYALFPHMNIYENIAFGLKLKKLPKEEIRKKVKHVLAMVDLEGFEDRKIATLSGGQQQRIAIARALVNEPEILMLDEPLGALDLKMRKEMQLELKNMHDQLGITFIYVTHDQEEALTMSDKIVVLSEGKIQQIGTPEDIYNEPKNAFVADFIGESNIFKGIMTGHMKVRFCGGEFTGMDDVPEGTLVDVVVRPEDVIITAPQDGTVAGVVTSVIFKGMHYEVAVESGKYEIIIRTTKCYAVGDEVGICLEPDGIHVMLAEDHTTSFVTTINSDYTLDFNGKVIRCDLTKVVPKSKMKDNALIDENGETLYAKLVTAGNMGTLTNRKYWWVSDKLVQNDNVYEYKIADKAKVDGYKITSSLAESIKNKVCEIKVQHSETAGTEITKIDKLVPNFQYTKGKYNHNTSAMIQSDLSLMNYDNPAVLLSGNIKTLVVPVDTAEKYDDDCYMAKYRIENDVSTHNVEFYGIPKDSQTPKLLVMKTVLSEVGTAGGDNETCILTEGVSKGVNEDDEECYFAQAYDKNGNEITLTIRNDFRFADSSVKNAIMDLCAGDVMEIGRDGQNRVLEIKVMASASRPIDGTQMGIIEKLQQNVIWNKSNGDDFYNVFFYMNDDDERVEAGIKAEYPIFRYTQGRNGYVDKISAADILTDENGVNADTVIIAGDIAVILPLD